MIPDGGFVTPTVIHAPQTSRLFSTLLVLGGLLAGLSPAPADDSSPPPFDQEARAADDAPVLLHAKGIDGVAPGSRFELVVEAVIDRGWHIYGMQLLEDLGTPTAYVATQLGPFRAAGVAIEPKPRSHYDDVMGGVMLEHEGKVPFRLPLEAPADLAPGRYAATVEFTYMVCDANQCLPTEILSFTLPVWVGEERPAAGGGAEAGPGAVGTSLVVEKLASPTVALTARGADAVEPGAEFTVEITAKIERGFHLYGLDYRGDNGLPVQVDVADAGPFEAIEGVLESAPKIVVVDGKNVPEHVGTATFRLRFRAPDTVPVGSYRVGVKVRTQACDAGGCELPAVSEIVVPVLVGMEVAGGVPQNGGSTGSDEPTGPVRFTASLDRTQVRSGETLTVAFRGEVLETGRRIPAIQKDWSKEAGFWGIVALSVGGALIALLTPCVYPMIPITISVFTKQAHQKRSRVIGLALLFCVGVMTSFTTLGLVLSAILGEQGANFMATNAWVNLGIGALFVYFAFSLFGYYDIQLPSWLRNRAAGGGGGNGVASVLVMGFVFSVATFTCVGPIAAALLALAAGSGPGYAAIGMLAFSATFALPFFCLALFPKALAGLPRSGGWLSTVKGVLGFVELIAAWKFFSATIGRWRLDSVISREVIFAIWGVLLLAMGLYLLGKIRFPHDSPLQRIGAPRVVLVLLCVVSAGFCLWAVAGGHLNKNLESQLLVKSFYADESSLEWRVLSYENPVPFAAELETIRERIAAGGERRPIFINFTGHV